MTTFEAQDGSVRITTEQAGVALHLFDVLMNREPDASEQGALAGISPELAVAINMGVAIGHALEITEQQALELFQFNPYFQRLVDALIIAYYEQKAVDAIRQKAMDDVRDLS